MLIAQQLLYVWTHYGTQSLALSAAIQREALVKPCLAGGSFRIKTIFAATALSCPRLVSGLYLSFTSGLQPCSIYTVLHRPDKRQCCTMYAATLHTSADPLIDMIRYTSTSQGQPLLNWSPLQRWLLALLHGHMPGQLPTPACCMY